MAFSRVDTICQYLKMPFMLSDLISLHIQSGALKGTTHAIRLRRNQLSLSFVLLFKDFGIRSFEPKDHLNFGL
jgi:hypothetical protein